MGRNEIQYVQRDESWLEFNARVLEEASDPGNPLLEQVKFLAIFSSNLDEFFMVRIAGIATQSQDVPAKLHRDIHYIPRELKERLLTRIRELTAKQHDYLNESVLPRLAENGIRVVDWDALPDALKKVAGKNFETNILPVLTPIGIDPSHPFPLLPNLSLELLVRLECTDKTSGAAYERFAVVEVPPVLPRFLRLAEADGRILLLPLESLIAKKLETLFQGCSIRECAPFRITRDMDLSIDEDSISDLLTEMQIALQKKKDRRVIRLEIDSRMSDSSRRWLMEHLNVADESVFPVQGLLNLKSLFEIASLPKPELKDPPLPPLPSVSCDGASSMFAAVRKNGPFLLHLPYESFDPVVRILEEAADDPNVLAIKQTLYRVGSNSPIVGALIRAARQGKQVTVLFEIKARFDEANNIQRAHELAEAGAHVVYGIAGLKVHCKALLIVRREKSGVRRYVHLGTGNYNASTAKQYTDIGYFTDDRMIAEDVSALFNVITGFSNPPQWNKLVVAPFNMKDSLIYWIDREAGLSSEENPGSIVIKANAAIDYEVLEHLYAAAQRHVRIDMIIRGICGLNPKWLPAKFAPNLRVVSIVDRFLEHARIYRFGNNGSPEYYLGSADVMPRNLRRRIELLFPVEEPELRKELDAVIEMQLNDKRKGRRLLGANEYSQTATAKKPEASGAQKKLYEWYEKRWKKSMESKSPKKGKLVVFRDRERSGNV